MYEKLFNTFFGFIFSTLEYLYRGIAQLYFWFLIHNFGSRYARKPIKGSKDLDDSLVSKKKLEWKN